MTSVNFNIGFSNERNSSRVLKPPGGGHTDIFGVADVHEENNLQKDIKRSATSLIETNLTVANELNKDSIPENDDFQKQNNLDEKEVVKKVDESKTNKDEPKPEIPKRVRVPPGGFSSGLW